MIIFTEMLIMESRTAIIILIGLVVLAIGLLGLIAGWSQGPDGINSGKRSEAASTESNPSPSKTDKLPAAPASQASPNNIPAMVGGVIEM
jgi:hypothetical protein